MSLLKATLKLLLRDPIVILVKGGWRSGKTDFSLLMGYLAVKWGFIEKIGSNIWTYNNPQVEYIITLGKLKRWLHGDRRKKLFIFDEALVHIPRRTSMSSKNVSILKLLGEISKGHGRIIFCSQITKLDSDILNPEFCRCIIEKKNKKLAVAVSKHWKGERKFRNIPRSPIKFDKDRLAPFVDTDLSKGMDFEKLGKTYTICSKYHAGSSYSKLQKEGYHPEEIRRAIKEALGFFLDYKKVEFVNTPE